MLRISTENAQSHVQTQMVQLFVNRLAERAGDLLDIRYFYGATLFRDQDVLSALDRGLVEMAVPGFWQLDRFVPDVSILMMPAFYGAENRTSDRVTDGEVGSRLSRSIETILDVTVIGRWIDLGQAHLFATKQTLNTATDVRQLRIRIPGGLANSDRMAGLGAIPVSIPWPDLPAALDRNQADGVLTTFETVVSGRLWEHGIHHCLEDGEYFPQYVPMIARPFWAQLSPSLQNMIIQSWEEIVPIARRSAMLAQAEARSRLTTEGIIIVTADPRERARIRALLMKRQPALATALGVNGSLLELATAEIDRTVALKP